eukprot:TRINITY_DN2584_c1_g1_i2.p1 TRINITY_DN2584_c1_g1~~TRINITY_DN2584_c1_g1_i2.p1  ORF type:complete len:539 (-),score=197.34 TRINITY_DN2584_c1_g1_i2:70-1686(-)
MSGKEKKKDKEKRKEVEKEVIFGLSLSEETGFEKTLIFLDKCFSWIEKHGIKQEGIFRLCGARPSIEKLKGIVEEDPYGFHFPENEGDSIHAVTGLLKSFFKELKDPLMTFELYYAFIAAASAPKEARDHTIKTVVSMLPMENRIILEKLCAFLHHITEYKEENKMSATNLGTCIGFILLRPEVDDPATIISDANLTCELFKSLIADPDSYFYEFEPDQHSPRGASPEIVVAPGDEAQKTVSAPKVLEHKPVPSPLSPAPGNASRPLPKIPIAITVISEEEPTNAVSSPVCTYCKKPVSEFEKVTKMNKTFHAACEQTLKSEMKKRPLPVPPNEKKEEVKSSFLRQYEIHRSQSSAQMNVIKNQTQLNDEQFRERLTSLIADLRSGEFEGPDIALKEKDPEQDTITDKGILLQIIGIKPKKTHKHEKSDNDKEKQKDKSSKFDPASVGGVMLAPPLVIIPSPKSPKEKRERKITLDKFGRKTSGAMEKLFLKKGDNNAITSPKEVKRKSVFAAIKTHERAEKTSPSKTPPPEENESKQ